MYQIANVYLTLLAGSAFTSVSDAIDNPASILNYISAALPTTSVFFINFALTQLLISIPLLTLQINQLIYYVIVRLFVPEKNMTRRMIVKDILVNNSIEYGATLPDCLYILAIALLYWVIAPIVLIVATLIFGATYVVVKYQYLYVLTRNYESGGKYWYGLYYYSMLALFGSTITMIAYMSIKQAITQAPLLLPLPVIIIFSWRYTEDKFKALSQNIPYSAATKVDLHQEQLSKPEWTEFELDYLKQPSLIAPKYVRPYPYRIDGKALINDRGLVNPIYFEDEPLIHTVNSNADLESNDTGAVPKGTYAPPPANEEVTSILHATAANTRTNRLSTNGGQGRAAVTKQPSGRVNSTANDSSFNSSLSSLTHTSQGPNADGSDVDHSQPDEPEQKQKKLKLFSFGKKKNKTNNK
jgi:hypothetical protein